MFSGGFPASNILTPPPPFPSCTFIGPCQNSSKLISVRTAAAFVGVDRVAATLRVYSEHSCDDMRLVLHVVAVCEGKDNGADAVSCVALHKQRVARYCFLLVLCVLKLASSSLVQLKTCIESPTAASIVMRIQMESSA